MTDRPLTYKESGVDIDVANAFVKTIKPMVRTTDRPEVLSKIGHFAGLFALNTAHYRHPILVASTDGVGTKLKIALDLGKFDALGQDLVAMSANDILCCGAEPLFFLDYYATGRLKLPQATSLVAGIVKACREIHCALLGGETAEMPSLYQDNDFDLAGFIVGVVEQDQIIDGAKIEVGDGVIGLASSGLHSNGFSLVRKILAAKNISLEKKQAPLDRSIGELLLEPTKLYVNIVKDLKRKFRLHGIAHITGGGLLENLDRILPSSCRAVIECNTWPRPLLFQALQEWGRVSETEMQRVFNCGIGLMLVVPAGEREEMIKFLKTKGETAWAIGRIEKRSAGQAPLQVV